MDDYINFAKFIGKHMRWSLFFNEVAGIMPVTLLKTRLQHRCFPVDLQNFSEHLLIETLSHVCIANFKRVNRHLIEPANRHPLSWFWWVS